MRNYTVVLIYCLVAVSCASTSRQLRDVDALADISTIKIDETVTRENAEKILHDYSIDFIIPNPLFGDTFSSIRKVDPSHQSTIVCRAILLDDYSTKADILYHCRIDSLDDQSCREFSETYTETNVREGMFRIRISLESGFSSKSMEPDQWALYIENSRGVMIEPSDITVTEVSAKDDSVFSDYHRMQFPRSILHRDITLYFKRVTFFGEDLFSKNNPFIVFVMSHKKKTVGRIAWNISGKEGLLKSSHEAHEPEDK